MRTRLAPSASLTLGLCLATAAFALWTLQATALDHGRLHDASRTVLSESTVHQTMANRVAAALDGTAAGGGDAATVASVASTTLDQPEFVAAFAGALDQVQEHVVDGTTGPITLDPALVGQAVHAAAVGQPQVTAAVDSGAPLAVSISEDQVPDLARWASIWETVTRALAFLALLLVTYGMLRVEHRAWAVGRIGRWTVAVGVGTLVVFWLLPRALLRPLGGWIGVAGAVLEAGEFLVPVAFGLIACGLIAVVCTHRWEANDRRRTLSAIPQTAGRSASGAGRWESPV
ncbi:MAG TPA: hypothetical protein VGN59_09415 [Acidimicrobiia bacterium]|jgi:hypothetical protein